MNVRLAPLEGNHYWYWKPNYLLSASEVMDAGGEPITTTSLKRKA